MPQRPATRANGRQPAPNGRPATRRNGRKPSVEDIWRSYERALVITAHPDDADMVMGGAIARICDLGIQTTLVVATSGDKGTRDPDLRPQELAAIREQEQRAAADILGISRCIFLGYPDGFLVDDHELRGHMVRLIRTLKPDLIMTWDGFRKSFNHTDHRVVGRAVRDALFPAAHDPHYYSELTRRGIGPWRTAEALLGGTDEPDLHVDIGPYLERKIDAIMCHTSQIGADATREGMLKSARDRAKRNKDQKKRTGYDFAESFKRIEFRRPPGAPGTPPHITAAATAPAAASRR